MTRIALWIALALTLLPGDRVVFASGPAAGAKQSELGDPMEMVMAMESCRYVRPDSRLCEKVARTKEFDQWIEAFGKGDIVSAEKHWGKVLITLKGLHCKDIQHLITICNQRTAMLDKNESPVQLLQHLLSATEHTLGPRDQFTADCYRHLAEQCEGAKDYSRAIDLRRRQQSIFEEKYGKYNADTLQAKVNLEHDSACLNAMKHSRR